MTREIRAFVYGREYIPTTLAESSTCRLLVVTDDQIEVLRNLVNYAHQRKSWNDETIDSERYYMPSDADWDDIEALVDDLEDKLMSQCDFVTLDDVNNRIGINDDTPAAALTARGDPSIKLYSAGGDTQLVVEGGHASLSMDTDILLEAPAVTIDADAINMDAITFPAVQVPSAGANVLDDYEEGSVTATLTPQTSGSIALKSTNQTLQYTKIGRLVAVVGMLQVNTVSSPVGVLRLGGLPFAAGAGVSFRAAGAVYGSGLAAGATTMLEMIVEQGQAYADVYKFAAGANTALAGEIQANSTLVFSCSYFSAT